MSHPTPRVPGGTLAAGGGDRQAKVCVGRKRKKKGLHQACFKLMERDHQHTPAYCGEDFYDSHAGKTAHEARQGKTSVVDGKKKERRREDRNMGE